MNCIICDDNLTFAEDLKRRIITEEADSSVRIFGTLAEMMFVIEDVAPHTDAIFMDINQADGNGINAAGKIAASFPSVKIVYVSGYGANYFEAMFTCPNEANPIAFLSKPVDNVYLRNALTKIKERSSAESDFFTFKQNRELIFIKTSAIVYIESLGRQVKVKTDDGKSYEFYRKLSDVSKELPHYFVQCHKSFIVNIGKIRKLNMWLSFIMCDETEIFIGRAFAEKVKSAITLMRR